MTHSLERMVFTMNESLHSAGILPDDRYITQGVVLFSIVATLLLLPFIFRAVHAIPKSIANHRYTMYGILLMQYCALYIIGGFVPVVIAILLIGFIIVINRYPQYRKIRSYIDKLF